MIIILIILLWLLTFTGTSYAYTTDSQEDICANAAVVMCDNFEARAVDQADMPTHYYKNNGWSVSCFTGNCPRITSDPTGVYEGSRSLKLTYPAGQNVGGGFLDSAFPSTNRTLYMRWYQKHSSNFQWSYIATKNMEWYASNGLPSFFAGWFDGGGGTGPKESKFYNYFTEQGSPWIPAANENGVVNITAGVWYCMETRYTINTTQTSTDGYLQGWVDGVRHWEYPNVNLNNQSGAQGSITGTLVSGYWNCYSGGSGSEDCTDPVLDNHPLMYRWIDNLVVSTEPIGCSITGGVGGADGVLTLFRRYLSIVSFIEGITILGFCWQDRNRIIEYMMRRWTNTLAEARQNVLASTLSSTIRYKSIHYGVKRLN